jgi:hypothetical protein
MGLRVIRSKESWVQELMAVIPATWGAVIWRRKVQSQPSQVRETPISKITRAKWTGGVAQVVEYLPCKSKALSSKPRPRGKTI